MSLASLLDQAGIAGADFFDAAAEANSSLDRADE